MASVTRLRTAITRQDFDRAISQGASRWYSACLRITGNPAQAEDAVQDALVSAWSKRSQFQGGARLETWIHRIAVNSALALLRRRQPAGWTEPEQLADGGTSPLEAYREQQLERDLRAALAALTDLERVCFALKHLEQWRLAEIAGHLEIPVDSVKQALFRALRKLRKGMINLQVESR